MSASDSSIEPGVCASNMLLMLRWFCARAICECGLLPWGPWGVGADGAGGEESTGAEEGGEGTKTNGAGLLGGEKRMGRGRGRRKGGEGTRTNEQRLGGRRLGTHAAMRVGRRRGTEATSPIRVWVGRGGDPPNKIKRPGAAAGGGRTKVLRDEDGPCGHAET